MRSFIVMAMFTASFAAANWNNYEEQRRLDLSAGGIGTVDVEAGAGSLEISGVPGSNAIEVTATIEVSDSDADEAREIIESELELTLEKQGDRAVLKAYFERKFWRAGDSPRVHVTVRMPQNLRLVIEDGSGSMSVSGISGATEIDDGSGSMTLRNVGEVRIYDGSGSITAVDVGGDMSIEDGSGSIEVEGVAGTVTIDDGSGGIRVSGVLEDLIIVDDGSGGLRFSDIKGRVEDDG